MTVLYVLYALDSGMVDLHIYCLPGTHILPSRFLYPGVKPQGGLQPFHQKSACITQSTLGQLWSRDTPNLGGERAGGGAGRAAGGGARGRKATQGGPGPPPAPTSSKDPGSSAASVNKIRRPEADFPASLYKIVNFWCGESKASQGGPGPPPAPPHAEDPGSHLKHCINKMGLESQLPLKIVNLLF